MASFNELTSEQMEKARECANSDELVELAKSEARGKLLGGGLRVVC